MALEDELDAARRRISQLDAAVEAKDERIIHLEQCLKAVDDNELELRRHVQRIEAIEEKILLQQQQQQQQQQEQDNEAEDGTRTTGEQPERVEARLAAAETQLRLQEEQLFEARTYVAEKMRRIDQLESQIEANADQRDDRIEELQEALRESVRITADRETALDAQTKRVRSFF